MKYMCMLISVADINAARKFYEDLFGLEAVSYTHLDVYKRQGCGLGCR